MIAVGLCIRLGIVETPTFQRIAAENRIERVPVFEVVKRQPKKIVLTALVRMAEQAPAYVDFAFIFTYGYKRAPRFAEFLASRGGRGGGGGPDADSDIGSLSDRIELRM